MSLYDQRNRRSSSSSSGSFSLRSGSRSSISMEMLEQDMYEYGSLATFKVNEDVLYSEISKAANRITGGSERKLTDATASARKQGTPSQVFYDIFESELIRVTDFIDAQQKNLEFSARTLLTNVEVAEEDMEGVGDEEGQEVILCLTRRTQDLVDNCLKLQTFMNKNNAIMKSVAELADSRLKTACLNLLERRFGNTVLHSALVCVVSDIYDAIRSAQDTLCNKGSGKDPQLWKAPSSFERSTTKYWVKNEDITRLLLACAAEAPLLVYGKAGALTAKELRLSRESEGDKLWDVLATPITSVYFDSEDMSLYKQRLARVEGAQLLRARWYGKKPTGNEIVFLELKTHHEKWVNTKSVKERVSVQENDMETFLNGTAWNVDDAMEMVLRATPNLEGAKLIEATDLLHRMHKLVVKHQLKPCVRSVYSRAAFQSPKSNALRLTIDRSVTLIDETTRSPGDKPWCLSDDALIKSSMTTQVPYVVFEVKLAGEDGMPTELAKLETEGVIQEKAKFSKFLTGAAAFNAHKVQTLPYWAETESFADMFGLDESSTETYLLDSSDDLGDDIERKLASDPTALEKRASDRTALKKRKGTENQKIEIAPKAPARVEPKSYFANERTFIQWISASLLLLTISTIMMGYGTNAPGSSSTVVFGAGIKICCGAVLIVLYATFVYFRRIHLLSNGKPYGYVDFAGPLILAVGVTIGVIILLVGFIQSNPNASTREQFLHQAEGKCVMQSMAGIHPLEYQPSDALVVNNTLLVVSNQQVMSHPLDGETRPSQLAEIPNSDLEGLTRVGDRIFALSEGPQQTELIELAWTAGGGMEEKARWKVSDSLQAEGLAFVPDLRNDDSSKPQGRFYIDVDGAIHTFAVPDLEVNVTSSNGTEVLPLLHLSSINMKLINQGLNSSSTKISGMYFFEGVTYLLHDNVEIIRAWDFETGELLAQIPLPKVSGGFSNQWEGIALERRIVGGSLRGSNDGSSSLLLHLTLDSPPQIWTIEVQEGATKGSLVYPNCAGG
mmetsp:Transcript_9608/g.17511  ORF Transcript_9608/g.17511 Transcript_9608/m.17511 type:complete len:1013 (+) Transcript_9608:366-3404(+)